MGPSIVRTTTYNAFQRHFWNDLHNTFQVFQNYLPTSKWLIYPEFASIVPSFFSIAEWPAQLLVWCTIWIVYSRFYLLPHACSYNHKKLSYLFIIIFGGQLKYISTLVGLHLLNLSWETSVLGWEGGCKGNWENC